ncbi:tetratricopeptide repeat protein [Desulfobacter sp.]|uniref:tetratricopeptide repeat protein n=1 Tax=Desulfobacter sp. TaxID=2294 RepID=UPI003D0F1CC3
MYSVPRITRITLFILLTLSFLSLFFSIETLDKKYPRQAVESFLYLPSGTFLKGAALGYDEMLADLLWIKALGYFGGHAGTDGNYTWLAHLLDVVTTLDPLYQYPYEFGGIVLAAEVGEVDKSIALLKKGMKNVSRNDPRYWYFPFFLAYDYMYHKDDYLTAAHYMEQAVKFPQSPAYLPRLVARLYANADSPEVAVTFLQEMIKATEKQDLRDRLNERLHQVIHRANMKMLKQGVEAFYLKFQKYPASIEELLTAGILPGMPVDPRGGTYYISKESRTIENTIPEENLEVHIKKKEQPRADDLPLPMRVPEEN